MDTLNIAVRPRECPDYCPYPSVCRIQKWRLPLILEEIKQEAKDAPAPVEAGSERPEKREKPNAKGKNAKSKK